MPRLDLSKAHGACDEAFPDSGAAGAAPPPPPPPDEPATGAAAASTAAHRPPPLPSVQEDERASRLPPVDERVDAQSQRSDSFDLMAEGGDSETPGGGGAFDDVFAQAVRQHRASLTAFGL